MKYDKWIYGGLMGISLLLLEIVNYRTVARQLSLEIYGFITGLIFLGLGVWVGIKFYTRNNSSSTSFQLIKTLSKREAEVLEAMKMGLSNKEIAEKLFVSENTIKTHVSNIFSKLNVKRRTQAIIKAKNMELDHPSKG